jgi:hypothetical protein
MRRNARKVKSVNGFKFSGWTGWVASSLRAASGVMTRAPISWLTVAMGFRDPQVDAARVTAYSICMHLIPQHRNAAPEAGASRHGCRRTDLGALDDTAEAKELRGQATVCGEIPVVEDDATSGAQRFSDPPRPGPGSHGPSRVAAQMRSADRPKATRLAGNVGLPGVPGALSPTEACACRRPGISQPA